MARFSEEPVLSRRKIFQRAAISSQSTAIAIYGTTVGARFRLMDFLDALDRMVQRSLKACLDAGPGDHRADLADSLPDHPDQLWIRIHAGDATHRAVVGGVALRH